MELMSFDAREMYQLDSEQRIAELSEVKTQGTERSTARRCRRWNETQCAG
jgi:hypothetical protein